MQRSRRLFPRRARRVHAGRADLAGLTGSIDQADMMTRRATARRVSARGPIEVGRGAWGGRGSRLAREAIAEEAALGLDVGGVRVRPEGPGDLCDGAVGVAPG